MPSVSDFESKGWFLSQEGIDLLNSENPEAKNLDDYISVAKDTDLRLLSSKGFNKTNEKFDLIPSPCVLQVLEIRNIALPSVMTHMEIPRLLSVVFTDGSKKKYKGVEAFGKVDCLKLFTPPGTKFLVTKQIEIKDQILLLGPGMLIELGGHVQELVQAWRAGKQFLKIFGGKQSSKTEDQGPPAFIPFKVKPDADEPVEKPEKKAKKEKQAVVENGSNNKPVEKEINPTKINNNQQQPKPEDNKPGKKEKSKREPKEHAEKTPHTNKGKTVSGEKPIADKVEKPKADKIIENENIDKADKADRIEKADKVEKSVRRERKRKVVTTLAEKQDKLELLQEEPVDGNKENGMVKNKSQTSERDINKEKPERKERRERKKKAVVEKRGHEKPLEEKKPLESNTPVEMKPAAAKKKRSKKSNTGAVENRTTQNNDTPAVSTGKKSLEEEKPLESNTPVDKKPTAAEPKKKKKRSKKSNTSAVENLTTQNNDTSTSDNKLNSNSEDGITVVNNPKKRERKPKFTTVVVTSNESELPLPKKEPVIPSSTPPQLLVIEQDMNSNTNTNKLLRYEDGSRYGYHPSYYNTPLPQQYGAYYYHQQGYPMDYNMMVPIVDPNTGMTMYSYPPQQYVYYMPEQAAPPQPYYNHHRYIQPPSYYDTRGGRTSRGD